MSWISDTKYVADFLDQFEYPKASPYMFKMACKAFLSQYKLRLFLIVVYFCRLSSNCRYPNRLQSDICKTFKRNATMEYIHSLMSEIDRFMASDMNWDTFNYSKISKMYSFWSDGHIHHARCQYIQEKI